MSWPGRPHLRDARERRAKVRLARRPPRPVRSRHHRPRGHHHCDAVQATVDGDQPHVRRQVSPAVASTSGCRALINRSSALMMDPGGEIGRIVTSRCRCCDRLAEHHRGAGDRVNRTERNALVLGAVDDAPMPRRSPCCVTPASIRWRRSARSGASSCTPCINWIKLPHRLRNGRLHRSQPHRHS